MEIIYMYVTDKHNVNKQSDDSHVFISKSPPNFCARRPENIQAYIIRTLVDTVA